MMSNLKKKVMLGMSGGVDSSVAAALLLEQGYEVIGVTMHIYDDHDEEELRQDSCCALSAVEDARRVAHVLGIDHYVMNFKEEFKVKVIDYFVKAYLKGQTPNPCIACNKYIKFDAFLRKSSSFNVDYIATGHYARVIYEETSGKYKLMKAVTRKKDQSYALYNLNQSNLNKVLLPIGEYEKDEIRKLADKFDLPVANKPDSQEICFVTNNDYVDFISRYMDKDRLSQYNRSGYFVDIEGNIIGEHKGIINYTIGQRKGLGVTFGKPMFVVGIDAKENKIILGESESTYSKEMFAGEVNYVTEDAPDIFEADVKIRYSAKAVPATVNKIDNTLIRVTFKEAQRAITPGQSAVMYNGDEVIGGGIIL